jgi:hypothetical protein
MPLSPEHNYPLRQSQAPSTPESPEVFFINTGLPEDGEQGTGSNFGVAGNGDQAVVHGTDKMVVGAALKDGAEPEDGKNADDLMR